MAHFDKPLGGTELMYNELMSRLPENIKTKYSIFNYPAQAEFNKKKIYWNQLSYDQDAVQFLTEQQNINMIDHFVFVSNWQAEKFRQIFKIPGEKTTVMRNAHLGIPKRTRKLTDKIKVCYTSTPWRGLDVLLKAWENLNPQNAELHVFSSCKIYGKDFAEQDSKYEFLYEWCERLDNVVYRGSIPNDELREELVEFDMLAYPSTFEETSCITVIEAISAGLRVVTSSLGALPETTEGHARIYSYVEDRNIHSDVFTEVLGEEMEKLRLGELDNNIDEQSRYSSNWSWDKRINDWEKLLTKLDDNKHKYNISKYFTPISILDIGANVGQFYKEMSTVYPDAFFRLIEGNEECEEDLKSIVSETMHEYHICLLSDEEKEVEFHINKDNLKSTGNSIYVEDTPYYEHSGDIVMRTTTTLDKLFPSSYVDGEEVSYPVYDLIKLDTQGSEIDIIKGGLTLIQRSKGIIMEVSHKEYNKGALLYDDVIQYMAGIDFEPVEVLEKIYHPITGEHIQDDILFINKNVKRLSYE